MNLNNSNRIRLCVRRLIVVGLACFLVLPRPALSEPVTTFLVAASIGRTVLSLMDKGGNPSAIDYAYYEQILTDIDNLNVGMQRVLEELHSLRWYIEWREQAARLENDFRELGALYREYVRRSQARREYEDKGGEDAGFEVQPWPEEAYRQELFGFYEPITLIRSELEFDHNPLAAINMAYAQMAELWLATELMRPDEVRAKSKTLYETYFKRTLDGTTPNAIPASTAHNQQQAAALENQKKANAIGRHLPNVGNVVALLVKREIIRTEQVCHFSESAPAIGADGMGTRGSFVCYDVTRAERCTLQDVALREDAPNADSFAMLRLDVPNQRAVDDNTHPFCDQFGVRYDQAALDDLQRIIDDLSITRANAAFLQKAREVVNKAQEMTAYWISS